MVIACAVPSSARVSSVCFFFGETFVFGEIAGRDSCIVHGCPWSLDPNLYSS